MVKMRVCLGLLAIALLAGCVDPCADERQVFDDFVSDPNSFTTFSAVVTVHGYSRGCLFGGSGVGECTHALDVQGLKENAGISLTSTACKSFGPCTDYNTHINESIVGKTARITCDTENALKYFRQPMSDKNLIARSCDTLEIIEC